MTSENVRHLIDRTDRLAADARTKTPPVMSAPHHEVDRPPLGLIEGEGLGDAASNGHHAGADLDQLMVADSLFDADAYGGRHCETCGASIDGVADDGDETRPDPSTPRGNELPENPQPMKHPCR